MYGRPRAGVYMMKNFIRRLFGRFHVVTHSDVLSYKGSWRKGAFHGYGVLEYSNGGQFIRATSDLELNTGLAFILLPLVFDMTGDGLTANKQDQQRFLIKTATGMKAQ